MIIECSTDLILTIVQGHELLASREAAGTIDEWPVYKTLNAEVAEALGLSDKPSFAVGTSFEFNKGLFKSVTSEGHKAFDSGLSLKESILTFLKTEQLPPYLPYSSATNARVFAMERQASLFLDIYHLLPCHLS